MSTAVAEKPKVRTVVYLPVDLSRRLRHTKADSMVPVTTLVETIIRDHFTREDRNARRAV